MRITNVSSQALRLPYKEPFHWAQGVIEAAEIVLVSVETDTGITGYGECMASAPGAVEAFLEEGGRLCTGQSPFRRSDLLARIYKQLFAARGTCSAPRFGAQVLAGLDMALWDIAGKAADRPVHELLGGAVHDAIGYFGFPQGSTAEEIARSASILAAEGHEVIYAKIGKSPAADIDIARQVRAAIGSRRLRLDANEAWDVLTAVNMIHQLKPFAIEFIEQPVSSESRSALAQVRQAGAIPIAADQLVFSLKDMFELCLTSTADLVVLGLHETGGFLPFIKAAAVAEAAGLNICLHGLYESGITTCASHQAAAVIPNLDDGNQFMNHFLIEDILDSPSLSPEAGRLKLLNAPGLGFVLNWDAVSRARECYLRQHV